MQIAFWLSGNCNQLGCVGCPLRHDLSERAQMPSKFIEGLGPLPDQKFAQTKHHHRALRFFALHRHEPHRRTQRGLADSRIVFPRFHKRFGLSWRDQSHLMTRIADLTASEKGAAASLHRDNARWKLAKILQDLLSSKLLAKDCAPSGWNKFFGRSSPTDRISDMTVLLCRSSQTHLATLMPSEAVTSSEPVLALESQHFNLLLTIQTYRFALCRATQTR